MAMICLTLLSIFLLASSIFASPYGSTNRLRFRQLRDASLVVRQDDSTGLGTSDQAAPSASSTADFLDLPKLDLSSGRVVNPKINDTQTKLDVQNAASTAFALAVCGDSSSTGIVASDSRTADLWTSNNVDDWFAKQLQPYIENGFKAQDGTQYKNIQSIILFLMGADGSDQCDEITDPNCSGQGLNWEKCKSHPEAHFLWFANTHWAHYLNKLQSSLTISDLSTSLHKMTTQFFTPQKDPQQLLVPFSIVGGIAGAIGTVWAPGGIISGVASIASGFVIQAGLDRADPLKQWGEVSDTVSAAYKTLTQTFEKTFQTSLKSLPSDASKLLTEFPSEPSILKGGLFAQEPKVGSLNDALQSGIAAAAINTLWADDNVFLMILDDAVWGKGDGQACQAVPGQTTCRDGVAYVLLRWKTTQTKAPVTPNSGANPTELDESEWFVWGAGDKGTVNGQPNANHLGDYGLDLNQIVDSVESTWKNYGQQFPFTGQAQAVEDKLNSHPPALSLTDFMFFSLPVCDLRAIMGPGKHINHDIKGFDTNPIGVYGGCLCSLDPKWPSKQYSLSGGLPSSICKKNAIKND